MSDSEVKIPMEVMNPETYKRSFMLSIFSKGSMILGILSVQNSLRSTRLCYIPLKCRCELLMQDQVCWPATESRVSAFTLCQTLLPYSLFKWWPLSRWESSKDWIEKGRLFTNTCFGKKKETDFTYSLLNRNILSRFTAFYFYSICAVNICALSVVDVQKPHLKRL